MKRQSESTKSLPPSSPCNPHTGVHPQFPYRPTLTHQHLPRWNKDTLKNSHPPDTHLKSALTLSTSWTQYKMSLKPKHIFWKQHTYTTWFVTLYANNPIPQKCPRGTQTIYPYSTNPQTTHKCTLALSTHTCDIPSIPKRAQVGIWTTQRPFDYQLPSL